MRAYRFDRFCMTVVTCLFSALTVLAMCGCGATLATTSLPPSGTGGLSRQNVVAAPVLGYTWDTTAHVLREIDGVPGAARVDVAANTGVGFATAVAARNQQYGLFLDSKGALYQATLPGGTPRQLAAGPWSGVSISASGNYAVAYGSQGAGPQIISGLPLEPAFQNIDVQGAGVAAAAVSDGGVVLLATKGSGGVAILASAPGAAASRVMTIGAAGGMAFVPGSDRALVADASSGTITLLDHVSGAATPSPLSGAKLSGPVGMDISADGRWALAANSSGTVMRLDLSGQSLPVTAKCGCTPTTVASLSGSAFRLTEAGSSTAWMVDAGGTAPRVLFIPALPGQKIAGGGQ